MSSVSKHHDLIDKRTALRQEIRQTQDVIGSVHRRVQELEAAGGAEADLFKARDKFRHTVGRLTDMELRLMELDAEIDKVKFEAGFED